MKIEVNGKKLIEAVGNVVRAVAIRPQLPVLAHILIVAEPSGIKLSATDLELGMTKTVPAKVEKVGKTTVPAKMFWDYISILTGEKIELELVDGQLKITSGTYSAKMQTIGAEEFPILPVGDGSGIQVSLGRLAESLDRVLFAVAKDSMRPVLTGVLFEIEAKRIRVVGTDGFRLALADCELGKSEREGKLSLVLPARACAEIGRMADQGMAMIRYIEESKQVVVAAGDLVVTSQVMEGNYPDYTKILPKSFGLRMRADREEMLQLVKSVQIFARDNSNVMRWIVEEGELTASANAQERGSGEAKLPVELLDGEAGKVVYNAKYVMDFLTSVKAETIEVGVGENLAPGSFRESGNESYLYVIMPINA